ncbi:hypothetical protein [Rossellomorea marisflavi]|uniref:hypothetical protein n=1 Tax=Rossellomorea marisflavi TaxID=189381 RepID=UPI00345763F4
MDLTCYTPTQHRVQCSEGRPTPAGIRGKVETLQAQAEAAQLPPRRKAAGRSGTERTLPFFTPIKTG